MITMSLRQLRSNTTAIRAMPGEIENTVTHGIGFVLSVIGAVAMLCFMFQQVEMWQWLGCLAFLIPMVVVYFASTCSHGISQPRLRNLFRQWDQGSIYLFIAGSYTPWAITYMRFDWCIALLSVVWSAALIGFFSKIMGKHCVTHVCLTLYVLLAWVPAMATLFPLSPQYIFDIVPSGGVCWLFLGGLFYMIGTIFWRLDKTEYHFHAIWHLLVMLGTACHYFGILFYVTR